MSQPVSRLLARDQVFHLVLFILLAFIVSALFLISAHFRRQDSLTPTLIRSMLDTTGLAGGPPPNLAARLLALEEHARERFPTVDGLFVTLRLNGDDVLVFPPFAREFPQGAATIPIQAEGRDIGRLMVRQSPTVFTALVAAVPWAALATSLGVFGAVYARGRRQSLRIAETRVELARKQEEIIRLERLALVGQMAAGILHDLKKPVLHIRDEADDLTDREAGKAIREQSDLFFQILREADVEGFLRKESARAEYVDLRDIVNKSVNLVRYEADGARFEINLDGDLPLVLGVRHRLIQVFSNLFLNALQATERRGHIRVTASACADADGNWLEVAVADDGPGIPEESLRRIFEPLYSTRPEGTGLGLYIVRTILEELGGRISVRSASGKGTVFLVSFPIDAARSV